MTLGTLGGAAFGGFKAYEQYEYLKESYNNVVLFKGEKLIYDEVFEGDSVAVIASGVEIDLREAEFEADYCNLDLYGLGAGYRVLVPQGINVIATGINKGSGIQIDVDECVTGKILNITYDLTGSGLMVASHGAYKATEDDSSEEEPTQEANFDPSISNESEQVNEEGEDELMAQLDEFAD